jgi:uncharacterized membrane protein YtjA (UPF0391 family)
VIAVDVAAGNPIPQGLVTPGTRHIAAGNQSIRPKLGSAIVERAAGAACGLQEQEMTILKWALIFLLVSIVAGIFGFTGISAASADVARFLFYVFVVIFLILLILGLTIFRV